MTPLESARAVADAVLYEGYVLYPYRASAAKNQVRWQWGVLMPTDVVTRDPSERDRCRCDLVVDGAPAALRVTIRFLQAQRRIVEGADGAPVESLDAGDATYVPWDEAAEHEVVVDVDPTVGAQVVREVPGGTEVEPVLEEGHEVGRLVRRREPLRVALTVEAHRPVSPFPVTQLSLRVENRTDAGPGDARPEWLRRALVSCHLLVEVEGAAFVSLLDPPEWARGYVAACVNEGVFPVLGGPGDDASVVLGSPIILYDHPEVAPESESTFFDSLEIDELLSLRTMTLSEEEKREVRGTDPRAAALLREVDEMPADLWDRLHGTVRYLDAMTTRPPEKAEVDPDPTPWWDPGSDASVDPESDSVRIGEVDVRRGTRVILRPGARRADAYDLFLAGRTASVAAVLSDVDGRTHLAITVDEDPGSDLKASHGRYLYFAPDEVEPLRTPEEAR